MLAAVKVTGWTGTVRTEAAIGIAITPDILSSLNKTGAMLAKSLRR